ncbi:MAG TPA: arginine--tRNA ligase, partial [Candidatus Paceibacterota bacterium]
MHIESLIKAALRDALSSILTSEIEIPIELEFTSDLKHGDYTSNIAMKVMRIVAEANKSHVNAPNFTWHRFNSSNPRDLAEYLKEHVDKKIEGMEKVEIAGPGFINFYLADSVFAAMLENVTHNPDSWGRNDLHKGEKIMIEYTDPNPFKEFHIGHLMSNAIGESIARLCEFSNAEVKRANYQGDVGPHVAKAIWGVQKLGVDPHDAASLGKAYTAGATAYESDEAAKAEIDAINVQVYDRKNETINEIYATGRKASLEHFEEIYKILGTKFDRYFFESETAPRGLKLVHAHEDIFEKSDGAIVYKGEQDGLHTRVFITSRGTPTYETKDLGLLELKQEQGALDTSITVTAHEQADYFKVMIAAAKHVPEVRDIASKTKHVTHGMMRFAEGKMSSRTGNVITGESLLGDVAEVAKERAA